MIYVYDSTMPGALPLTGQAGALKNILKTYLVDGAGAGPVATLTVASEVATLTYASGHPFRPGAPALIAGATPAALNGIKSILTISTNSATFAAPGVPDGAATGTITSKLAPAGWTELFPAGGNLLALKSSVPEATGHTLRVDDTGTTNARVRVYESMSDINTGTGPTPLDSQVSGGLWWPKSSTADATGRPWYLIADAQGFYFAAASTGGERFTLLYAGDIQSYKSGDAYGYLLAGNAYESEVGSGSSPSGCCGWSGRSDPKGAYLVRSATGLGQSILTRRVGTSHNGPSSDVYAGRSQYSWGAYPNAANNGIMTGAVELFDLSLRGRLPGLLHAIQDCGNAFLSGARIEGTDDYVGRRLMALRVGPPDAPNYTAGTVFINETDWGR